jgi:hypothetical protein
MITVIKHLIPILFLVSCAPDEFVADNDYDPENPDYIPPIVSIVSGPSEGQTLTTESAEFTYSGNELMLFRTKLDTNFWSGWVNSSSITLDYLDEGDHVFFLQGKFATNDTSQIVSVSFEVDAVDGPSLMFLPRRHISGLGDDITFKIIAEEVYGLAGTEFILNYDPATVSVENVLTGDIFSDMGDIFFFYEDKPSEGKLIITSAVWGSGEPSYTGTAVIAEVSIQITQLGEIDIVFDGSELFRDPDNESIQINTTIPGKIESY